MKFKCLISGTVVEFFTKLDIDSMLGHTGYVVVEDVKPVTESKAKPVKE